MRAKQQQRQTLYVNMAYEVQHYINGLGCMEKYRQQMAKQQIIKK